LPPADTDASFLAPAVLDGDSVFATNGNGSLYRWAEAGCGAATCAPTLSATVDVPVSPTTTYSQAPAAVSGMLFVAARRAVTGTNHVFAVALAEADLHSVKTWDVGATTLGAALASVSVASGVVYVPTGARVVGLHPPQCIPSRH